MLQGCGGSSHRLPILFGAPMEAISIMWAHVLSPNHCTKDVSMV
jgi:hypothetical protein